MQSFSHFILRRAGWVAGVGTFLALVGGYYSVQLYKNLRTNFEELLPTTARSVLDLAEVSRRLHSIDSLAILIFSKHAVESKKFVVDLARRLEREPKSKISSVEYQISKEIQFFKQRQALYMEISDLERIHDYIEDRIDYEKELRNPLNIFSARELPEPRLDFNGLRQKYGQSLSTYDRFPGGFYATPDETKRAVLVYLPGEGSSIDLCAEMKKTVESIVADLNPKSYAPDIEIRYTGGVQQNIEEHEALIADLELSTVIVTVVVSLAMILFFRAIRATLALVLSLFMGTFWTFGVSYFAVGYLNANSAFLGSIVIGNGINFGIIVLARYLEERRRSRSNPRAVRIAVTQTLASTWTAALAAGLSYGSLVLTGFRGFKQFGIIGLIGMVLCWLSAVTLLPAYLTLLDRIYNLVPKNRRTPRSIFSGWVAHLVDSKPGLIWGASFCITLLSLATFFRYSPDILETNLTHLRNKDSVEKGAVFYSKVQDEIFQRYLSPLAVLPHSRLSARKVAKMVREKKEAEGKNSLIASVQTLDDFVPSKQKQKIELLKQIRRLLPPYLVHQLSPQDQKQIAEFLNPVAFIPITEKDLPQLLVEKFTEKDGTLGNLVLVEPPLDSDQWKGDKIVQFVQDLRETADSVELGTPVAGGLTITADMIDAISKDGPRATVFAFVAVVLLVIFVFRNVATIALVLFALILGVIWLAGIILGFDLKINFLNFIALPITFGIGVDYGVNIFQRYRQEGGGNILNVIRNTGGAVALCSFSTIVGYCSLLIAKNQGFVSFGLLAVAGELTCVIAAVLSLPAYLLLRHRRRLLGHSPKST